jgi:arsenate reductase
MALTQIIWHNPRCSKSRQTLALLQENGHNPIIRDYQKDAPNLAELRDAMSALGLEAKDMIRTKEAIFKELALSLEDGDEALLDAMATHPKLIERPIVFAGNTARIGRPPEQVLEIL